jgi:hypothetical protein
MDEIADKTQSKEPDSRLEDLLIEGLTTGEDIPLTQGFWIELRQDAADFSAKHNM